MTAAMNTKQSNGIAIGFGLVRPFQRDGKSDFSADGGERLIRSAVAQILGTIGASDFTQGELPWRPELGSLLHLLLHQRNDAVLQQLARVYVVDALKRWEPRVQVTSVLVARERDHDRDENILALRIRYDIVSSPGGNILIAAVEQTVKV